MSIENGEWIMRGLDWYDPARIQSWDELIEWIDEIGFLPLFKNEVDGFSAFDDYRRAGDRLSVRGGNRTADGGLGPETRSNEQQDVYKRQVYSSRSVAAAAVACHECGHAIQHAQGLSLIHIFRDKTFFIVLIIKGF